MANLFYLSKYGDTTKYKLSTIAFKHNVNEQKLGKTQSLAYGRKVRDVIAVKRTVSVKWDWLPHLDTDVHDGGVGFLTLLTLYEWQGEEGGKLTFEMPNGEGGAEILTCYMGDRWSVEMHRRLSGTAPQKTVFWTVGFDLIEV